MIPILYDKSETAFTSNGLGRLSDCIRCIVTEQRNGVYECEFEYPVNGNHFDDITVGRIIACTHDDYGDVQPFDIYSKSEPINGVVTFNAHHISYRLNEITVKPFEAGTVALALQNIKNYSVTTNPFTFWTDRSSSAQFVNDVPRKARNMLGGEENSILDVFGTGEYEFDKFTVRFYAHRGQDTNISIRYAKNLTNFENDYDIQDSYTAVVPFWKGQNDQSEDVLVTLSEWYILSGHTVDSGRVVCVPMDLSTEFDTPPTEVQLRTKAQSRLSASDAWNPNQTVKINFVQLWQTEEYRDYAPLQRVRLCDTVGVFVPMYNMSLRAKVISVTYNVLLDRYDSMTLGDKPTTYANVIEKQYDSKVAGIIDGFAALSSSISGVEQALVDLQDDLEEQIDAKIETWAQTSNPASSWTTSELRAQHNNDLWLYTGTSNITVGSVTIKPQGVYQYNGTNNTWVAYSSTSSNLFDLVDGKSTIFYGSPTGTYANKRTGDYLVDASTGTTYRWTELTLPSQYGTDVRLAIDNMRGYFQYDSGNGVTSTYSSSLRFSLTIKVNATVNNVLVYPKLIDVADETETNLLSLPYYEDSQTKNGITFTVNNDGSILCNGTNTASGQTSFVLTSSNIITLTSGHEYKLYYNAKRWVKQTDYQTAISNATVTIQSQYEAAIQNATDLIRGGTGGYVVTTVNANGQPIELLVVDNLNLNQAQDVWRWNQGGFGHSSTGYNGTYTTAITQDGHIVADFIDTGTLIANIIKAGVISSANGKVYFDLDNNKLVCDRMVSTSSYATTISAEIGRVNYSYNGGTATYDGMIIKTSATSSGFLGIKPSSSVSSSSQTEVMTGTEGFYLYTRLPYSAQSGTSYSGIKTTNVGNIAIFGAKISSNITDSKINGFATSAGASGSSSFNNTAYGMIVITPETYKSGSSYDTSKTGILLGAYNVKCAEDLYVWWNFTARGTKSREVDTENYNNRLLYCYETPTPMFGDIGEANISDDGLAYIEIDDIFSETISNKMEYQVFLQKEGQGDCWIKEKNPRYFVVQGTPNLKVAWELKAKQKDYDIIRLERNDIDLDEYYFREDDWLLENDYISEQEDLLYA